MKPLAPNTMIQGRYLVVHLIGKGGMGEVYLAVDQRLGSAVALKRTSFADDETLAAAFEREAKILARLRHPVLPKVSDHFAENGEQYLIMEHISGDDLSKRLETAGKAFPVSWVMFWADQLLDALSYLHSHEPPIVHRDIKPQNLKLTDENHIILLDFGLSKDTENRSVISAPGTSGSVVGYTPHFAPMEQIRGTGTNPRSDIYSLSATLYQLMTNTVPADALSRADSLINGIDDPIRPLSDLNPEISPAVSNVILKGMEVSQDKRFGSASEMQKALRSAYAQMQGQMSADTVAFTAGSKAAAEVPPGSRPLDSGRSGSAAVSERSTGQGAASIPDSGSSSEVPSMDATIRMDAPPAEPIIRQADVKTEVFLASDLASSSPTPASPYSSEQPMSEEVRSSEPGPTDSSEPATGQQGYEPAATVPLFSVDQQAAAGTGEPAEPEFFQTVAASASTASQEPVVQASSPPIPSEASVKPQPPAKKKSLAVFLLLGLAGVFILIGGVAGGGWYYYTNYMGATVEPSPTPIVESTPTPSPSPTSTPEPTPTPDANLMTTDANSNSNSNSADDAFGTPTPTPQTGTTSPRSTPQGAPTRDRTTVTRPTATPKIAPTPKPKPSNDRTVILQ